MQGASFLLKDGHFDLRQQPQNFLQWNGGRLFEASAVKVVGRQVYDNARTVRLDLRHKHVPAVLAHDVLRHVQAEDRPVVRIENVICENAFQVIVGYAVPVVGYADRHGLPALVHHP